MLDFDLVSLYRSEAKQFAEEVAKEKLGLVNPDEILLKPNK